MSETLVVVGVAMHTCLRLRAELSEQSKDHLRHEVTRLLLAHKLFSNERQELVEISWRCIDTPAGHGGHDDDDNDDDTGGSYQE
jgi:hypothetical protein